MLYDAPCNTLSGVVNVSTDHGTGDQHSESLGNNNTAVASGISNSTHTMTDVDSATGTQTIVAAISRPSPQQDSPTPLLTTVIVNLSNADGRLICARALVDPASQFTLLPTELATRLHASLHPVRGPVSLAAAQEAFV